MFNIEAKGLFIAHKAEMYSRMVMNVCISRQKVEIAFDEIINH